MPFVKVVKTKAYFKRYQTKYKRRREGKTDYHARRALVKQSKNKYNSPKYRFVVRISNSKVVCQIIYSEIVGDKVICHADSAELKKRYGLKVGLKNYAACYATGLLCARRLLTKLNLAEKYTGIGDDEANGEVNTSEVDGKTFYVEDDVDQNHRPFRAALDVGIQRVTTGNRVMGCVKGACDGGLDVPHNEKRFPGYDSDGKSYDAGAHAARIYGEHIGDYMEELDEEEVSKLFADYVKAGINHENIKEMWQTVHKNIRKDPKAGAKSKLGKSNAKFKKTPKLSRSLSLDERRAQVKARKDAIYEEAKAAKEAADDEDEDDEDSD